jgi:hypothetical protein
MFADSHRAHPPQSPTHRQNPTHPPRQSKPILNLTGCYTSRQRVLLTPPIEHGTCMKAQIIRIPIALVLSIISTKQAPAQFNGHVTGAPLSATWSYPSTFKGKTTQSTSQIARETDASTYQAYYSPEGKIQRIEIDDVPNNCTIRNFVVPSGSQHSIILAVPPGGKFRTSTVEEMGQQLRRAQRMSNEQPYHSKPTGQSRVISLGERSVDGMTLFGVRSEFTSNEGEKRLTEYWQSDLGLVVSSKTVWPAQDKENSSALTNLRRGEPDPHLFGIPKEYIDHADELRDAKTIFFDNQTGSQEILDGVETALITSTQLTVAADKDTADLIAKLTIGGAKQSVIWDINVDVFKRGSFIPLLQTNLGTRTTTNPTLGGAATKACLVSLWSRLEKAYSSPQ